MTWISKNDTKLVIQLPDDFLNSRRIHTAFHFAMVKQPQNQFVDLRQLLGLGEFGIDDAVGSQGSVLDGAKAVVNFLQNHGVA